MFRAAVPANNADAALAFAVIAQDRREEQAEPMTLCIIPDQTGSVLSLDGIVYYEQSGLSPELILDLRRWKLQYYKAVDRNREWKSADLARRFTQAGNLLAQRIADELGNRHKVGFASPESGVPSHTFRATGPAANPLAAAAFEALLQERENTMERQQRLRGFRGEAAFGWIKGVPYSYRTIDPRPDADNHLRNYLASGRR